MLRLGVCGLTSDHVWRMVGGFQNTDEEAQVICAAEPYHPELFERARAEWSVERTYSDYEEMLAGEDIDAVVICANSRDKEAIVEAAARSKRHVLTDKPMAATFDQAANMARAARNAGIHLMVAYHNAFNPTYVGAKDLLTKEVIGKLYLAKGGVGHGGPREFGCSEAFCEWLFDADLNGGGCFVDEACYIISQYRNFVGEVSQVGAFTTQIGYRDYLPSNVEDNSVAILQFENGALGTIDAKWGQVGSYPFGSSIHGVDGTLLIGRNEYRVFSPKKLPSGLKGWVRVEGTSGPNGRIPSEQQHFVDVLRGRVELLPEVDPEGGLRTQAVIEAVYESARAGKMVSVSDLIKERAADLLLSA